MNAHVQTDQSTDIAAIVYANPVSVLLSEKTYSQFYEHIKSETASFVPDTSTASGRKEIAAIAYKVTRTKTAIDAAGKKLNEEARAQINAVDASRRKIRDELDALAEEVRRPLTEWEEVEKRRATRAKEILETVIALGNSAPSDDSQEIRDRITELGTVYVDPDIMGDDYDQATAAQTESLAHLNAHLDRALKAEADAAELARLRAENEERERLARESAEKEEAERLAKERADRDAAEQKAREERAANAAREKVEREAKEAIERAEREKAEAVAKAEAEARAVREAAEREHRQREVEAKRIADEQAARDADKAHRSAVMKAAKKAVMAQGADEETAKKIVLAIVAGEVPNVTLRF